MNDKYTKLDADHSPGFNHIADVLNWCFPLFLEKEYLSKQQATTRFTDAHGGEWAIWYTRLGRIREIETSQGWINALEDHNNVFHSWRTAEYTEDPNKWSDDIKRIVFSRFDNEPIYFMGVYVLDKKRTRPNNAYFNRIASRVDFSVNPPVLSLAEDEKTAEMIQAIEQLEKDLETTNLTKSERDIIAKARIGQGEFRNKLLERDKVCRICGMENRRLLVASHIKPWSKCDTTGEKWDSNNGLLLCSIHDALFDNGLISFDPEGRIMISESLSKDDRERLNLSPSIKITMPAEMADYMEWHNNDLLKNSKTVSHQKFGLGIIEKEDKESITVHFNDFGTKTLKKVVLKDGILKRIF